ncbi:MAG: universal stress protein [Verrucomicrobia bacterium]|nr:universal stress protein [Verrucomicrobiota bacterium]
MAEVDASPSLVAPPANRPVGFKHILVAVDDSSVSAEGLRWAVALAERFGSLVSLLQVVDPASSSNRFAPALLALTEKNAEPAANEQLCGLARERIPAAHRGDTLLRVGRPASEIVTAARDAKADLLVLSAQTSEGRRHPPHEATARQIVRRAPCPTLIVRETVKLSQWPGPAAFASTLWKRIFLPVDLSDTSRRLLGLASSLAEPGRTSITLLYTPALYENRTPDGTKQQSLLRAQTPVQLVHRLSAWASPYVATEVELNVVPEIGMPAAEVIALLAARARTDLILASRRAASWWRQLIEGRMVEQLLRIASCSVLTLPDATRGDLPCL